MFSRIFLCIVIATLPLLHASAIEEQLQNDGFTTGAPVTFQAGFVIGEVAAARYVPQISCPCVVTGLSLLFGGSNETQEMGLQIWEDPTGSDNPGALLYTGSASLTGSNLFFQEIDLSLTPIIVNGPFRVGLEFAHNGSPSVATDLDGTIDETANFILADLGGFFFWFRSSTFGVAGDFIIRATIDNLVVADSDGDGIDDSVDNCTLNANPGQEDTDGDLIGNRCDGDFNNDCTVNFSDIIQFPAEFLGTNALFDHDASGMVAFPDYAILTSYFLQAPGPSAAGCN